MSTYGELVSGVIEITKKPSHENLIRRKINSLIRLIASSGDFWRAVTETTIGANEGVDPTQLIQSIPLTSDLRKLAYVRYPEGIDGGNIDCLNLTSVISLSECTEQDQVAYLSGNTLHIRHSTNTDSFLLGYYAYPAAFATDGTDDDSSNWITENLGTMIEDLASAYILNLIGETNDSKQITQIAASMEATALRDQVDSTVII